ncbi:MAG: PHP domain-containing protein [Ferruginibacter sp.]
MTNYEIADSFSLLSKLMDIHGEDSFKARSYSAVAFAIEKLPVQLSETDPASIASIKGIGTSSSKKITELLNTGKLEQLEKILLSTPAGVADMLNIKGIGPKKIHTIWKEMELENIGELLYACKENRLKLYKGFGEKTQETIAGNIEFYLSNKGNYLYAQTLFAAEQFMLLLKKLFPGKKVFYTGAFARQMEIITELEFVAEEDMLTAEKILSLQEGFEPVKKDHEKLVYKTPAGINITVYPVTENITEKLIETSCSEAFLSALKNDHPAEPGATDEASYFNRRNLPFIPAFAREDPEMIGSGNDFSVHLQHTDVKGLIHCHSNWSDGNNTIEEMAIAAAERGMEYLAISDHSKTAAYAQGLREEQIQAQHLYIDELNEKLKPFKIFKSIESDILGDGSLDYSTGILSTFDLVIASVHSNLKMTEEKAMARMLAAIENPYTTILGHMTGRLLLSRPGYPLDFIKIIDACAANHVVIELNANPNRLDMDWRYIKYALSKNVLISVNPDAHSTKGIDDIKYGIFSAQKAMLPKEKNLSSFSRPAFEAFLTERKKMKGI